MNFQNQYSLDSIDKFYSDAYSDHYLAEHAKEAYIVYGEDDRIAEWNMYFAANPKLKKE